MKGKTQNKIVLTVLLLEASVVLIGGMQAGADPDSRYVAGESRGEKI